jgi:lipoprotein-releasing system permease protein
MTLVWQLAWRYLKGKGTANVVPVLSRISMAAIAVGSCAMIVLFSVFNGFEDLIKDLYKSFYPEVKISPATGKFFRLTDGQFRAIEHVDGIRTMTVVIEDNVLLTSNEQQYIAVLKGIDRRYLDVNNIRPYIYEGKDTVSLTPQPTALVGLRIAAQLGLDVNNVFSSLSVYYPNTAVKNPALNPQSAFQSLLLKPAGIFQVQDEFDSKYILAPISLAQELFLQPGQYSSVELALDGNADPDEVKNQLRELLGSGFNVATRYEQNKTLYMVMKTEKWVVYAILVLVLLIASFNMVGALTMLVIEKQKDIAILQAMGATSQTIRKIFIMEGVLWATVGGLAGILLGAAICKGQEYFQWIKLEGGFLIEAYPVSLQAADFMLVMVTVIVVGLLAAVHPALRAARVEDPSLKAS